MDLINQLKTDGTEKGLCRQWRLKLQPGMSVEDLAKLYIEGIDFCISEDYPTLDFLRKHFKGSCEPYGVFVDDEVRERNAPDVVLNGDCKAILEYDGFTVARISFSERARLKSCTLSTFALVPIILGSQRANPLGVPGIVPR